MAIDMIITIALTAVTLLVWLFSFLMGLRDGTAKGFWKFLWAGLSALAAFGLAMLLRSTMVSALQSVLVSALSSGDLTFLTEGAALPTVLSFVGAIAAPVLFGALFMPVRWLLMIPQKLLWKHLVSPNLDKRIKNEQGELRMKGFARVAWNVGGGIFRTAATILVTGALFLGFACFTVETADAARPFVQLYENKLDKNERIVADSAYAVADHFSFRTAAFTYGGIFRTMTSVQLGDARTDIPEIMEISSSAGYQVCLLVFPADGSGLSEAELATATERTIELLCESDFFSEFLSFAMNQAAEFEPVRNKLLNNENEQLKQMGTSLLVLMGEADAESVRTDLTTLASLLREAADSGLLAFLADSSKPFPMEKVLEEERMSRIFLLIYDNSFGRVLFTPALNMALKAGLDAIGADPIELEANIESLSRKEMEAEAKRLARVAAGLGGALSAKNEGGEEGETSIRDLDVGAIGEAFDLMKESALVGDQYEQVLDAVGKSEMLSESLGDKGDVLIGAIKDAPSVEDALVISQSFTVIAEELANAENKGDGTEEAPQVNKEDLASALKDLVSSSNEENTDFILEKVDEIFPTSDEGLKEEQREIVTSILEAATEIEEIDDAQATTEAESLLGLYSMISGDAGALEGENAAEEIVDNVASSTVLMKTVENAVEKGTDFGITENLSTEDLDKIEDAIGASDATEEAKAVLLAFFGR